MNAKKIMAMLPERPRDGMIEVAILNNGEQFGDGFMVYRRESLVEETVPLKDKMNPEDWEAYRKGARRFWGAVCTCTECGEEWLTGWAKGGKISLYEAPDGTVYEAYGDVPADPYITPSYFEEGDTITCPRCGKDVTLIRRTHLRRGRTYQLMVGSVENIGDYTAVLFWLVSRTVFQYGDVETGAKPCAAIVIDRDGEPLFFTRARFAFGGKMLPVADWKQVNAWKAWDPLQERYHSYDAINYTKMGGWTWPNVPDVTGKTGEKTGLADYVRDGGGWLMMYLLFWRRHPAIENVVKSGWTVTIDSAIDAEEQIHRGHLRFPKILEQLMKWESARPCDILGMSRKAAGMGREWQWDCGTLSLWDEARRFGLLSGNQAEDFQNYIMEYGYMGVSRLITCVMDGEDYEFEEVDRYLRRQSRKYGLRLATGMNLLFDYRVMLERQLGERTPTPDELWPRNLRAAHDRLIEPYRAMGGAGAKAANEFAAGFDRILKRWGALQWTDGEFCALLPRCPADLIDEGHKLHHCVGSYARTHTEGKIVVFIRHYRRPERSWFTLNEDLTGDRPRRIQLHGYGNEYANGKHLTIPKKVLDFCERWERKVLVPVFREVKRLEREKPKHGRRDAIENRAAP